MSGREQVFPIRMECGSTAFVNVRIQSAGVPGEEVPADFERLGVAYDEKAKEVVIRLRVKCLGHKDGGR